MTAPEPPEPAPPTGRPDTRLTPNPETGRLYVDERLTLIEVGKRLGMAPETVSRHLAALNIKTRRGGGGKGGKKAELDIGKIQREYDAGDSCIVLGERYGVHRSTINRRLAKQGKNRTVAEANRLRSARPQLQPGDLLGLATDLAMDPGTVAQLLHKHGFITAAPQ